MILDWDGYRQELSKRIGDLGRLTPATVRGYRELSDAGSKTAHLDAKTRELIAIAVGTTGSDVSRDGGRTWLPLDGTAFNAVQFAPSGVAFAVGARGRVARLEIR